MNPKGIGAAASRSASIRSALGHPVIDADGHWIETAPVMKEFFLDYVKSLGGSNLAERFEAAGGLDYDDTVLRPWGALSDDQRRATWATRPPWWTLPAANTLDRATAHLPGLLAERLDDFGIDFAVLYPSRTLTTPAIREAELRQIACRALNIYHAELYGGHQDRMTPVAMIPMHTPEEGIAEIEYAVGELGLKAIMINGLVHRPIGAESGPVDKSMPNWGSGSGERIDTLGLDSAFDYDPFWRRCLELGVAPASHTPGMGWGSRRSVSSYVANHIGSFGASMEALCRGLFLGGVTRRFPELSFGMLEGGVAWACELYAGLVSHWEKRNAEAIHALDPARIDGDLLLDLFARYGDERTMKHGEAIASSFQKLEPPPPFTDEFAACEITKKEDIRELFEPRFYFGCEADDPMVAWAFDSRINPMGARLRAMFSSDMGHWDVPEMSGILEEAFELVEKKLLDEESFRDFVLTNPVRFYTSVNPDFFAGTRVEEAAAQVVGEKT
ncbi:MAG: amidohydrolase family protein [Myxococcota bacterium]|nr:amidohydrolase family protein [Myxococcota bacterium]